MRALSTYVFIVIILAVRSAPRTREKTVPQTVYDQKQTGEYNIQVHLKDLEIVALLSDEALGDYDYDYDYSDFTIKPPANVTLKPPPNETSVSEMPSSSSPKPENMSTTQANTEKPEAASSTTAKSENDSVAEVVTPTSSNTNSPDRIKVQIIQDPGPNISIVPSDEMGTSDAPPLGEILHYRRCATGYARDKKGRCRRVRRPNGQIPFNISRLASNLAARFQQASSAGAFSTQSASVQQ